MVDYGWNYPLQDYSKLLMAIGGNFGEVKKRGQVGSAMAGSEGDMQAAAKKLLEMGRVDDAAKILGAAGLADYRGVMAAAATQKAEPSFEEKLLAPYAHLLPGAGSVEPFRLGPDEAEAAEASGAVPPPDPNAGGRPSLETAPAKVQDILGTNQDKARWKAAGKGAGERASFRKMIEETSPQVQGLVGQLSSIASNADPDTLGNALGPWQGLEVDEKDGFFETLGKRIPQNLGALNNWWEQGQKGGGRELDPTKQGGGYTDTLRDKVHNTSANLVNIIQRALRVPGIGAQSDAELKQLLNQVGNLNKSRTVEDFNDRLANVISGFQKVGFQIEVPAEIQGGQISEAPGGKLADRLEQGDAPNVRRVTTSVVRPDGTVEPPAASMIGEGADARRVTSAPPKPPAKALNALKAYINNPQYREEAIRKFEEIYGEGAAQLYLGLGGR
jgi:hypothetical protein